MKSIRTRAISVEARSAAMFALQMVRRAVLEGPQSTAHRIAFGGSGRSDGERGGVAHLWFSDEAIKVIQDMVLKKIGEKIGTRPRRS